MLNRTILHLAFLSALLVVSLAASSHAQEKAKEKKEKKAIDPAVTARVTKLIEALKDKDYKVRLRAALGLGEIGPAAKDAVPALKAMSETDPEASGRRSAETALKRINK